MRLFILCLSMFAILSSTACSHYKFPWVYRIDVEQGNDIDEEKLAQVQIGMTQVQVKYLLGSPILRDTFDQSRWDYYYSYRTGKGVFTRERVTLTFDGNILQAMEKKEYEARKLNY